MGRVTREKDVAASVALGDSLVHLVDGSMNHGIRLARCHDLLETRLAS